MSFGLLVWVPSLISILHGPHTRYTKLWVAHAPGMPGTFSLPPRVSDPDMHHDMCVTHVLWCMPGLLISGFLWSQSQGKHTRRMRNQQFCVSDERPIGQIVCVCVDIISYYLDHVIMAINHCHSTFLVRKHTTLFIISFFNKYGWLRWLKSFLLEDKDKFILYSQYHGCWWPGAARSQDISSNGTDPVHQRDHVSLSLLGRIQNV